MFRVECVRSLRITRVIYRYHKNLSKKILYLIARDIRVDEEEKKYFTTKRELPNEKKNKTITHGRGSRKSAIIARYVTISIKNIS